MFWLNRSCNCQSDISWLKHCILFLFGITSKLSRLNAFTAIKDWFLVLTLLHPTLEATDFRSLRIIWSCSFRAVLKLT